MDLAPCWRVLGPWAVVVRGSERDGVSVDLLKKDLLFVVWIRLVSRKCGYAPSALGSAQRGKTALFSDFSAALTLDLGRRRRD